MKVLLVNSARGMGGGTTSALELATGMAGRGHEVTVACHPHSDIRRRLAAHERVRVAPVAIRAELNPLRPFQLARVLRSFPADVIVADRRKDVKLSFLALRLAPGAALVHRHGAPSRLRDGAVYRAIWPRLAGVIVNSHTMARLLTEHLPWFRTPVHVVPNGKDLEVYRPRPELRETMRERLGIPANAFVVSYHGALTPRKNVDGLIRALALRPVGSRLHALIIGEGEKEPELRALVRRYGVPATFAGRRSDIPQVLAAADVAVHLSSAEGFSNSVIEALACGLPVIASHATSHPEQVDDGVTGRLVPPGDEQALLAAILELAEDPVLLARSASAAREAAEKRFSLEGMIAGYERALEDARRHLAAPA